ncbi:calcium and integrin-binding 1-like [Brachionus plicatilis]|uniref:Calcium and integrin-binding 1-like n=1 Tax=Brachionus plicatilis TaxID=10195 RepID=A0A3M7R0M3_BRAPC|nr:calcium and integrin-binding 1-like [Brachionus plicatilis]
MGSNHSAFQSEENKAKLAEYQKFTYLKTYEIFKCYEAFEKVAKKPRGKFEDWTIDEEKFREFDQFKNNPFLDRIFEVFSNGDGAMSFEHYLNMMSVFSDSCPTDVKAKYAFRIYDFKNSHHLDQEDIGSLIEKITVKQNFSEDFKNIIIKKIFEEADIDGNDQISLEEFNHIANKYSNDFQK